MKLPTIFKLCLSFIFVLALSACAATGGHVKNLPSVDLSDQLVVDASEETDKEIVRQVRKYLSCDKIDTISLLVEGITKESYEEQGANFMVMSLSILSEFGKKVRVFKDGGDLMGLITAKSINYDDTYIIYGAITAFDRDLSILSSGRDFGLEFGRGSGETSTDNRNRNNDSLSSMAVDILAQRRGEVLFTTRGKINIERSARGYDFGIRVNDSGFGVNAYRNKEHGVGESLRKLLYGSYADLVQKIIYQRLSKKDKLYCDYQLATNSTVDAQMNSIESRNVLLGNINRTAAVNDLTKNTNIKSIDNLLPSDKSVSFYDLSLEDILSIPNLRYSSNLGIYRVDGAIINRSKRKQHIEYRVDWADFSSRVTEEGRYWNKVILEPTQTYRFSDSAKLPDSKIALIQVKKTK